MKCRFCNNYMSELDTCKFCHFEFNENEYGHYKSDDWDILNLKEEDGWEHIQILDRLYLKKIDCYKADIWYNNDMAYLLGVRSSAEKIAKTLNLHPEVVYHDGENDFMILNLFQEKYLRKMEEDLVGRERK